MKYTVRDTGTTIGHDVRVYIVTWSTSGPLGHASANVWVDEARSGRAQCTNCSGPLQAMLSTCSHARAVKRFLAKNR